MKLHYHAMAIVAGATLATGALAEDKSIHFIQCGSEIAETYPELIAAYEADNPGIKIDVEVVDWGQCQDKATTLASAGDPAAMAYVGSRTLKQFRLNDLIVPIDMTEEEKSSYWPNILSTVESDGEVLGLPTAFSTKALYWNKDLYEAAGLDPESPPTTWQELYDNAAAIRDNTDAAGYGLVGQAFDNTMHQYLNWVYTNGGSVIDGGEITLNSPNNVEALTWYGKMTEVSQDGPVAYERGQLRALFNDSLIGMFVSGPWERVRINEEINWGVAPLPVGPQGAPGTLLITDSLAIFNGTGVEAEAMAFAKYLTNPENQFAYEKVHGLTPLRPVDGVNDLVAEDPTWKPFLDGIAAGGPEPLFLDYKGFQDAMSDAIQSVLLDEASPEEAIAAAAEALEDFK